MIIAGIFFDNSMVDDVLEQLLELPVPIKPMTYSLDENGNTEKNQLTNKLAFSKFREKNKIGFFLHADRAIFDVSLNSVGLSSVFVELSDESLYYMLVELLVDFASLGIDFGFAADNDEYEHRNRHFTTQSMNSVETWVGRDLSKYVPGFYWLTFVSKSLAKTHEVDMENVRRSAKHVYGLKGEVIGFFDTPFSWQDNMTILDDLCESTNGVFTIKDVESTVSENMNFLELHSALASWK
ncbi:hypothetical protein SL034_004325 [Vibrio harveyi]|uniref:hypothetical protein n=1 Tax=Vibrio harveyi TaxID=669 RepID=UPI0029DE17F7|nr:hypothetical protein [Vibrio harveyi]